MSVTSFGPYELQGLLGRGGMGEVYRAFHRDQARVVALKLLPPDLQADAEFAERFRRESHAAARLNDPHVIPIHHYGEIDGRLYIDMRLVDGVDLAKLIAREGPLPLTRAARIIGQAAEALDAAHAEGLVHRDVKPSNLLVTPQDFVYLVDFGIAHVAGRNTLTATGATIGTLAYMAPERFGRGDVDARADVYSLACVLYEVVTGRRPFPVEGAPALIHAHLNVDPPRATAVFPGLPSALDDVIARGMAKDPAARFRSAGDLASAVSAIRDLGAAPVTVTRPPPPDPPRTFPHPHPVPARSRRWGWVAAAAGFAAAALLLGVLLGRGDSGTVSGPNRGAAATSSLPSADLGLATPISSPACDGRFAVIVGSSVAPGLQPAEVERLLARHPGSSYLLAEAGCASLRARLPDGRSIYAVYLGPFDTVADACAARERAGGDSYIKVLDDVSPTTRSFTC